MTTVKEDSLVWIDMEMSGLDPDRDVVLEIAILITNAELEILEEGPQLIVHQEAGLFQKMDKWNQEHHTRSGLWKAVQESLIDIREAERQVMAFLSKHVAPKKSPLCGNSIAQDRMFLRRHMPAIHDFLHYRMIDVSTVKELARRWYPAGPGAPLKSNNHRALDDIRESIAELRFYRDHFFVSNAVKA